MQTIEQFRSKTNIKFVEDYLDQSTESIIINDIKERSDVYPILKLLVNDLENWVMCGETL